MSAPCGHRRCTAAVRAAVAAGGCLLGSLAWFAALPSAASGSAFAGSAAAFAAAVSAVASGCRRQDDEEDAGLMVLVEATREDQRFTGLDGHFAEWEQEMMQ